MGFFAGQIGRNLITLLKEYGIQTVPIWVDGETRISHVIAETKTMIHSHVITGDICISANHTKDFIDTFKNNISKAKWVIFGGSLPASLSDNFYSILINYSNKSGIPSLIDSQKEYLVEGIKARPDIVKMNREEFEWTFNQKADSLKMLIRQARELKSSLRIEHFVITLSGDGILALTPDGDYHACAPLQTPINAAGSGDAVSSALVWKLSQGYSWESAIKWAAAVSAASVLTERTADVDMHEMKRIYTQVKIENIR